MTFIFMIFAHIVADFYIHGVVNSAMSKDWWLRNQPGIRNRYDYIVFVVLHSIFWTFSILFPIAYKLNFAFSWFYTIAFVLNAVLHGFADNIRINHKEINLIVQEIVHLWQITLTYLLFVLCQLLA